MNFDHANKDYLKRKLTMKEFVYLAVDYFKYTRAGCFIKYLRIGFTLRASFWMAVNRL